MGDYFNATRGPLAASLNDGSALSIPPKRWIYIKPELENSSSVTKLLEKRFLVKAAVPITVEPVAEVLKADPEAAPIPAPSPSAPAAPADGILPNEVASTSPMKEEIFKKKR